MVQVILGAGGSIGKLLAKELLSYTSEIRLVSRNPEKVNPQDQIQSADLLDSHAVNLAVAGSQVVYLVVGLKYDSRVWKNQWPIIIDNVVEACLKHNSKLVFFDNVYMYSKDAISHMTEVSERKAPSEKGRVRQEVEKKIQDAIESKGLKALIARSADFYGPGSTNGILNMLVIDPIAKGGKMKWQSDINKVHSFTFTVDAAKAVAMLGNTDKAYGEVWHLPTSSQRWTGEKFMSTAALISNKPMKFQVFSPLLLRIGGWFSRTIFELGEMQYQNTQDYFFDSSKFCEVFDFQPTSYDQGIEESIQYSINSNRIK